MRRTALALIALSLALAPTVDAGIRAVSPPPSVTATSFVFSGRGWGHGVGMSQYGALGYAEDGLPYGEILAHYYTGATLGPAPVAKLRVLLAEAKGTVTVASESPFRVRDVFGKTYPLPAGKQPLGPKLEVTGDGPTDLTGPVTFLPGKSPISLDGVAYRGQLEVAVVAKKLNAIDVVGLEDYLAGVVPREMPAAWAAEALKAQAVAARSYALAHRAVGKSFDLYADVRSQVYGGIPAEDARATAAIEATAGEVLFYAGKIVDALFHSTSGGRTVSAQEAFGSDVPYLVAVDDPHSDLSPVNRWGPTPVSDVTIRKGFSLATPVLGLTLARGPSGRVRSATVTTTKGTKVVTANELRFALGLRSTWVTALGTLALTRPGGSAVAGRPTALRAVVKGLKNATLEQRTPTGWQVVAQRAAAGELSYQAKLTATTSFRLSAGKIAGPALRVPVGPLVKATAAATAIEGQVAPFTVGAPVQVQRLEGTFWLPAGTGAVDESGTFRVELDTGPGTYRVRVPPAGGLAQGLSAAVTLS